MEYLGISEYPSNRGSYLLILAEAKGERRLPIVIGHYEAQAIALGIENMQPPRPMTHDLLKNVILSFNSSIDYIFINSINGDTFYALIVYTQNGNTVEIDARPSDAIAMAIRFNAPIYVDAEVLEKSGINSEPDNAINIKDTFEKDNVKTTKQLLESLHNDLNTAIEKEDYEKAAEIRDAIDKLKK